MKKIFTLVLALACLLGILASCGDGGDGETPSGMKKASGEAATYTLYIPENWVIDMQTGATTAHVSATDKSNVSVMALDLEHTDDTVDDWWQVNLDTLKRAFTEYTEISTAEYSLGEQLGKEYIYTAKLGDDTYKYRQVAAVKAATVYVFTYTATPEGFDTHLEDVEEMIGNFKYN